MSILFLLASLGVINGILLGVYLIFRKEKTAADAYFGGLLLALSIRIGKSVFFYFNRDVDKLILQVGLSACIFIGPLFYLYTKALQEDKPSFKLKDNLLLLFLFVAVLVTGLIFPYRSYPEIWNSYIIQVIYIVWALFTVLGLYNCREVIVKTVSSPKQLDPRQQYILAIILGMLFITFTYQFALFIKGFTYIWGALAFSFTFYYLLGRALLNGKAIIPKPKVQVPLENGKVLMKQVDQIMEAQKPFINQKLKLEELATLSGISRHTLSRVLNEEYGHGFAHYIKTHRITEAKQLIKTRHDLSLEGIGYESGFNSKSAFFDAFKKIANCTPSEYKKSI